VQPLEGAFASAGDAKLAYCARHDGVAADS
jgi:hypothetical protein